MLEHASTYNGNSGGFMQFKSAVYILGIAISVSSVISQAATNKSSVTKKSSAIPDKREFPLNNDINPCVDFHKYVCEKVENSFELRPDRRSHDFAFNDSDERLLEIKKKFMKDLPKIKNLDERSQQFRNVYVACMNEKAKADSEKNEVKKLLTDLNSITSKEQLIEYQNKNAPNSLGKFISMYSTNNQDDSLKMDAYLDVDFMLLPDHNYYQKKDVVDAYTKLLVSFFKTMDPKVKDADAKVRADNIMKMQFEFIKTYPEAAIRRQRWSEKHVTNQENFVKKYPNIKMDQYFANIPKEVLVNTPIPESIDFYNNKLADYSLETWKDLYLIDNLFERLDDGYPKFFKEKFDYNKKYFGGPVKRPVRQERCTKLVSRQFEKEIDASLIDKVFPNFDESKIQEVGQRIRQSILNGLKNNTWLSSDSKKFATEKIQKARLQLVKPHTDREWDFFPLKKYSDKDALLNSHLYSQAVWEKNIKEMHEPANQDAWGMGPLTVNAYYSPSENKFVMPMGILQYPFYDQKGSILVNLGAVGAVMGHELGHSIDDNGSKYDASGKLNPWMPMRDLAEFNRRGSKMVEQFNKADHNGALTLGENVADLVGLSFAYQAAFPENQGTVQDKKDFFVSYARVWCNVTRPDFDALLRKTDPHASGWARINEQVKHQPAFAEAYQCKETDPMSLPEKERIKIW